MPSHLRQALHSLVLSGSGTKQLYRSSWSWATWLSQTLFYWINLIHACRISFSPKVTENLAVKCVSHCVTCKFTLYFYNIFATSFSLTSMHLCVHEAHTCTHRYVCMPLRVIFLRALLQQLLIAVLLIYLPCLHFPRWFKDWTGDPPVTVPLL